MTLFIHVTRTIHIAAATVALSALAIPFLSLKGSPLHRRAGWVYVGAMAVVAVTAVMISGWRILFETSPARRLAGVFLIFIALVSASAVCTGVRVLRAKAHVGPARVSWDMALPSASLVLSVGMLALGFWSRQPLFAGFAPVGILLSAMHLRHWLRPPASPLQRRLQHMTAMITSGIVALTTFIVGSLPRFGFGQLFFSLQVWLIPTLLGAALLLLLVRRLVGEARS